MKLLKLILAGIVFFSNFTLYATAQDEDATSGRLLKYIMARRQAREGTDVPLPGDLSTKLDVPYSNDGDPLHTLDVYFPTRHEKPVMVLFHIHGGGWKMGDKKLMRKTGIFYASQGFLFITPNYRLSPQVQHPAHVEDCAKALAWTFEHVAELGGDKNHIFVSGHSAGAHLAALLGTSPTYLEKYNIQPTQLAGVIPVDTASFNFLAENYEEMVKDLLKKAFGNDEEVLKEASPFYNVSDKRSYPGFLIFNTANRKFAVKDGEEFADKLKSVGCDVRFVPVDDYTHKDMATGMYDESDLVGSAILKFMDRGKP